MTNNPDEDDWSNDSASLFRAARRAHDPTPAESARLAAVLTRIQATKAEASLASHRGADGLARGAASALLRQVASVSLGVVCIAAASFAFIRFNRQPSDLARSAEPAPAAVASAPPPSAVQPARVPSDELSASAQRSATRDEAQSRPTSQRRRSRATAQKQQTSRIEVASVPEASSAATRDKPTSVTAPEHSVTPYERPQPGSTAKPLAAPGEVTPRATPFESNPQESGTAAMRKAGPRLPAAAPTELALMKRLQGALRDADFVAVLAVCAEHARRWPHGVFAVEREGARAIASCGTASDDAVLRAKRFLTAHPDAPVAMRVSAACAAQLHKR